MNDLQIPLLGLILMAGVVIGLSITLLFIPKPWNISEQEYRNDALQYLEDIRNSNDEILKALTQ